MDTEDHNSDPDQYDYFLKFFYHHMKTILSCNFAEIPRARISGSHTQLSLL